MGTSRRYRSEDYSCSRCGKSVENMNREEQDQHEIECKKQEKLF